jgi:hypothetical protein
VALISFRPEPSRQGLASLTIKRFRNSEDNNFMRSCLLRSISAALTILVSLTVSPATALEVFGNSGISSDGVQIGGTTPITTAVAMGFTFGTGNTFTQLESITLALNVTPAGPNLDKFIFALYSSSGSLPDTEVARFSSTPVGGFIANAQAYTFNYASGITNLSPSTSYWIVATYENQTYTPASDTPAMNWRDSSPIANPSGQNGYNVTFIGAAARPANFGAWAASGDNQNLRVSLNLVPEPSTYALAALGTLTLAAVGRRKSRKIATV